MSPQFNTLCQESTLYDAWNTVKSKGSAGGIDGMTIEDFNKDKIRQIQQLKEELLKGSWKPQPYLQISIPKTKDPSEKRIWGMAVVRDKIVQQAVRSIIEPRFERLFLPNSYAFCHSLLKYFHKYHKNHYSNLVEKMKNMNEVVQSFKLWKSSAKTTHDDFMQKLIGHEPQVAIRYWNSIRELFSDDDIGFDKREHQGASDIVNSMLNYGYAILYVRVWQALLAARLNPFDSIIHAHQEGKPTLVYDTVEIFRSQVVDSVVISLIQKGQDLSMTKMSINRQDTPTLRKIWESTRTRMKFSVFECMLADIQYQSMCKRLARLVVRREDWVYLSIMYRMLCTHRIHSSR